MATLVVTMAGSLLTPGALADHNHNIKKNGSDNVDNIDGPHEPIPNMPIPGVPKAECVFTGTVEQDKTKPNPALDPIHNHVTLAGLTLECLGLIPGGHFDTTFEVEATAGSDGDTNPLADPKITPDKSDTHGATAIQGWSHSNGYDCGSAWEGFPQNTNKGNISAENPVTDQHTLTLAEGKCDNPWDESWFKFAQGWLNNEPAPPDVIAWGQLAWNDPKDKPVKNGKRLPNCFKATAGATPIPGDGVLIEGTAIIYDAYDYIDMKGAPTPTPQSDTKKTNACDIQKKQTYPPSPSSGGNGGGTSGGGGSRGPNG